MKLEWLEAVVAVAKLRSFSEAAETIPCAQSSVSRHVRSVEEELGVTLFDRSSNSNAVLLTAEGKQVLPLIEHLLEDWSALRDAPPCRGGNRQFPLRLGLDRWMFSSSSKGNLISAVYLAHPEIQLTLQEIAVEKRVEALLLKEIDAALFPQTFLSGSQPECPRFIDAVRCEPLEIQPLTIAVGADFVPAERDSISLKELKNRAFIFHTDIVKQYHRGAAPAQRHGYIVKACLDNGFEPRVITVDRELADVKQRMAVQGKGVFPSTIPAGLREFPGLRYLRLEDAPYSFQYYLLFRAGDRNPAIPRLVRVLRDCFDGTPGPGR